MQSGNASASRNRRANENENAPDRNGSSKRKECSAPCDQPHAKKQKKKKKQMTIIPFTNLGIVPKDTVHAILYEWVLTRVPEDDPMHNITYVGQVVRKRGTPAELLKDRTGEHLSDAARKPKELGLHWAIQRFGADAFEVRILEKEQLPRIAAMEWANEREKALISERGGIMRDREPETKITNA